MELLVFEDRPSDSPFVERVWYSHSEGAGVFHSIAACHWEMAVTRHEGRISVNVRGPETRATTAEVPADGEWFGIRFRLGTFMPLFPPLSLRDRRDVTLPDATSRSFWLNGSAWEYPNFENAETFVERLVRGGLIALDPAVDDALRDRGSSVSLRTTQRRFRRVTGLTHRAIRQIERARHATRLLRQGHPIATVACDAGYFDQAHLTRSLKRLIGQTPAQIARGERQLSLLYNTARV
jgi:AraC-like DNA-binding protein